MYEPRRVNDITSKPRETVIKGSKELTENEWTARKPVWDKPSPSTYGSHLCNLVYPVVLLSVRAGAVPNVLTDLWVPIPPTGLPCSDLQQGKDLSPTVTCYDMLF